MAKRENTNVLLYGVKYPMQSTEIRKKMQITYTEKHGVNHQFKLKEVKDKILNVFLQKYGCENPSQSKEIYSKIVKSYKRSHIFKHWKTNELIGAVGSYEKACVEHWNKNKIDFQWQVRFETPFFTKTGKKSFYFIDAYLPEKDVFIEIKGYMRERSKLKWEWFHEKHHNSELWDLKKLKELKILC